MTTIDPLIFPELCAIIAGETNVDPDSVTPDARFSDFDLDSLDLIEIAMLAEERWNIELSDDELEESQTVGQLAEAIHNRIEADKILTASILQRDQEADAL